MISLVRIDSRLIHGQVIEGWVPHLGIGRIVVADDVAVSDPLVRAAMGLAVPAHVEVRFEHVAEAPFQELAGDAVKTLVLLRDVPAALRAYGHGLLGPLNLGNVHAGPERQPISRSVFLTEGERAQLLSMARDGQAVTVQAVPTEPAQALS